MEIERFLEIFIKIKNDIKDFGILLFAGVGFMAGTVACMVLIEQMGGDQPIIFDILFYIFTRWISLILIMQIVTVVLGFIIWRKKKKWQNP